jgi:hypothetical protein
MRNLNTILLVLSLMAITSAASAEVQSTSAYCGAKAVEATQGFLKLNRPGIVSAKEDASSLTLVDSKVDAEDAFELWDTTLAVREKDGTKYRSAVTRTRMSVILGEHGNVRCFVTEISMPLVD